MLENLKYVDYYSITHIMYNTMFQSSSNDSKDSFITPNNSQNILSTSTQDTHYAESTSRTLLDTIPSIISNLPNISFNPNLHNINYSIYKKNYTKHYYNIDQTRYYETLIYENIGIIKILPEDILSWYPGFNLPIGTRGRSLLRKDLHRKRTSNIHTCDIILASKSNVANRSNFGDMRIVDLYHSAYLLGIWNAAAHYCLETCERRGFRKEWILCLKESGYEINIHNLKQIKLFMLDRFKR